MKKITLNKLAKSFSKEASKRSFNFDLKESKLIVKGFIESLEFGNKFEIHYTRGNYIYIINGKDYVHIIPKRSVDIIDEYFDIERKSKYISDLLKDRYIYITKAETVLLYNILMIILYNQTDKYGVLDYTK